MNKLIATVIFGIAAIVSLAADEKTAVWERIYQNATSDEMRYEVMLNIRELHDPAFSSLLNLALTDLVSRQIELGETNQVDAKVRLATLILQELGDLKDSSAADQIYLVYRDTKNFPLLRSEAAIALGKSRAVEYVPQLAKSLDDLNLQPDRENAAAQEIRAFGLVQALALMKDARGFEPTFFASIGWYSPARKVKETARAMLKVIVSDPTEPLLDILSTQASPVAKLQALQAEDDSSAPAAQKAKVALTALEEGVRLIPNSIVETTQFSDLRKKAYDVLMSTKDHTPGAVALYRQAYITAGLAKDTIEILKVLQTLGVNGTPESLDLLTEKMSGFNTRSSTPGLLTDFDVQQVRTILQAFKTAASPAARPVLLEAQFLYTPALQRDIKAVLAGLPQ